MVQRKISVTGILGYYDKRTALLRYYGQQSGKIILNMYPDNVMFSVLILDKPRELQITDGITGEAVYADMVSMIHFKSKSENVGDTTIGSWREYQNKKVTKIGRAHV